MLMLSGRRHCRGSALAKYQRVKTPTSSAIKQDKQKEPAIEDCWFAMIKNWKKSHLGVDREISHRHFASGKKSPEASEQSERNEKSAAEFDPRAERTHYARRNAVSAGRKIKNLLSAVTSVHQTNDQPRNAKHRVCKSIESVHGRLGCPMSILGVKEMTNNEFLMTKECQNANDLLLEVIRH